MRILRKKCKISQRWHHRVDAFHSLISLPLSARFRNGYGFSWPSSTGCPFSCFLNDSLKSFNEKIHLTCMHHVNWWLIPVVWSLNVAFREITQIIAGILYITFAKITNKKCRKEFHCKERKKNEPTIVSRSIQLRWKIFLPPVDFQFVLLFAACASLPSCV